MSFIFAVEQSSGISSLGLSLKSFIFQMIAFVIILWILNKFAFSKLFAVIDRRRQEVEEGLETAEQAKQALLSADAKVEEIIRKAHTQATDILTATQKEAAAVIAEAEEKAARRAENIVSDAKSEMTNQLQAARESLKKETLQLVALATEQILSEKIDAKKDAALVDRAIKSASGSTK